MPIGAYKHVFMDWSAIEPGYGVAPGGAPSSWEMPYGVRLAVHHPRIAPQPLVTADRPWESFINVYSTLLEDEGLFRLYYECYHCPAGTWPHDGAALLAYAECRDGVTWVKPTVGTVSIGGSTDNNIVYGGHLALGRGCSGATVFKDPSAPPAQRYKLVHYGRLGALPCLFGAVSADGVHWQALEQPLLTNYRSDTQSVVSFDDDRGVYVGYFRGWTSPQFGGRRIISYAETSDFSSWPAPQPLVEPDAADSPDTDIYTNGYTRWPGATNAHLMFPTFYRRAQDTLEVHLLTSRDGLRWQRPLRAPIIATAEPGTNQEGGVYAGCGLAALRPGEWSLPIATRWHTHNQPHFAEERPAQPPDRGSISRAYWRQDGFMSLEAESMGGCTTMPLIISGSRLVINAWTRFGGEIRIELATPGGETIAGHSFADCDAFSGDSLEHAVRWRGNADLSPWLGRPMRLRLRLCRARVFSLCFQSLSATPNMM